MQLPSWHPEVPPIPVSPVRHTDTTTDRQTDPQHPAWHLPPGTEQLSLLLPQVTGNPSGCQAPKTPGSSTKPPGHPGRAPSVPGERMERSSREKSLAAAPLAGHRVQGTHPRHPPVASGTLHIHDPSAISQFWEPFPMPQVKCSVFLFPSSTESLKFSVLRVPTPPLWFSKRHSRGCQQHLEHPSAGWAPQARQAALLFHNSTPRRPQRCPSTFPLSPPARSALRGAGSAAPRCPRCPRCPPYLGRWRCCCRCGSPGAARCTASRRERRRRSASAPGSPGRR